MQPTERYSHGYDDSVLNTYRSRTVQNSAAYLLPHLQDATHLLDVGCGPGSISIGFAQAISKGQVTAIDVSTKSIEQAQQHHQRDNLHFQTANVYALPFADAVFDVVHAHQVLQHLSQPLLALQEMQRVLKPNGVLALRDTTYASMHWQPASAALSKWMALYQAIATRNGGNPNIGPELARLCQQAGAQVLEQSQAQWHFQAQDGSVQWWAEAWATRLLQSDFAQQAVEYGLASFAQLQKLSQDWREWGEQTGAEFSMTHHQVLARRRSLA